MVRPIPSLISPRLVLLCSHRFRYSICVLLSEYLFDIIFFVVVWVLLHVKSNPFLGKDPIFDDGDVDHTEFRCPCVRTLNGMDIWMI